MKLYLATINKYKAEEIQEILKPYGITILLTDCEKVEPKEWTIEKVAAENAERIANTIQQPVLVDDTGIFFDAYADFPGINPKWVFDRLGYKGLLKLLEGEIRTAKFRTAAAICFPGEKPHVFVAELHGTITEKPVNLDKDVLPYERIFIPAGYTQGFGQLSREEKNKVSHRGKAFRCIAEIVQKRM
ncbi:MAG: non-canonical purine NTP pyrophosphatase [Candidatus Woesearchaeota archaeon]